MLDQAGTGAGSAGDYVDFFAAGIRVVGAFRCAECSYGVTVHGVLPVCPMCAGAVWEPAAWSPFAQQRQPPE